MITVQGAEFHVLSNHNSDRHLMWKSHWYVHFLVASIAVSLPFQKPPHTLTCDLLNSMTEKSFHSWPKKSKGSKETCNIIFYSSMPRPTEPRQCNWYSD